MRGEIGETQFAELSALIADRTGLHFPPDRWDDLQRGLTSAAPELGFNDAAACANALLSQPPTKTQIHLLATHLTIGETFFFREKPALQALAGHILPELIRARRGRDQRLRLWSAASCSGEEPYTLAILLQQILPDLANWHVTITATDINARFLKKAATGIYGEWSFRDAPPDLKQRYFTPADKGRYALVPAIRKMVKFVPLNLVEDVYPSLETNTNAMDVIFCRNVLMYFTPPQAQKVIAKLHHALVEGGWLCVSPTEASKPLFPQFASTPFPGFFQKRDEPDETRRLAALPVWPVPAIEAPLPQEPPSIVEIPSPRHGGNQEDVLARAENLYQDGHYEECSSILRGVAETGPAGAGVFSLLARALANLSRLDEALAWCDRWIAADKMNAASHYLRAVVLLEKDETDEARASLQRAVYLDPRFVLAHFALGNLARNASNGTVARKHFTNALDLVRRYGAADLLPQSEGLTAGRLEETITAILDAGLVA